MNSPQEFGQEPGQEPRTVPPPPVSFRRRDYYQEDSRTKSPALATIMSIMPGLGQVYVGYYQQGFINIVIVASLITLLSQGIGGAEPLAGMFLAFFWLYNLVDAARRATMYNQALAGLGPLELPSDIDVPSKGSLYAGILMIVIGGIVLAHTRFGLPLEWLERWWPAVLVIVGAYLVVRSYLDQKQQAQK